MCGIIGVLQARATRAAPDLAGLLARLDDARERLAGAESRRDLAELEAVAAELEAIDAELRGPPGMAALLSAPALSGPDEVETRGQSLGEVVQAFEAALDAGASWPAEQLEAANGVLVRLKDAIWAIERDRPGAARGIADLGGSSIHESASAIGAFWAIDVALSALDRLEVRGRDSAGLHLLVTGHGLDLDAPDVQELLSTRVSKDLFTSLAVRTPHGHLSVVYKVAAEIGELGDNTRALRSAIRDDRLLQLALTGPDALVSLVGHTRWASVGVISEANAHPLNSEEAVATNGSDPYVIGAVNGDVDNYRELSGAAGLRVPAEISTDSKVVPTLVARRLADGTALEEAFCQTVAGFDGSAAIAVNAAAEPERLHLALHGSGQALYVGLAEDAFLVSSETYGVVQETSRYLSMNGEGGSERSPGEVMVLDRAGAGTLDGVRRLHYDGTVEPVDPSEIRVAEVTTRDIDRAGFPHFLLKEISEAPQSFRKTLRGKIVGDEDGLLQVQLAPETLPPEVVERLASGAITRITVVAQGTAAVAGHSVADAIAAALAPLPIVVGARLATELSGFGLADDMSDTLIVAVSQSGTTTDTNRTVDLARSRGAAVIAIVNRRNSDLVDKSHGVLYTSDGRDVEMSVASTKAFYAQVAAGMLLALALADRLGCGDPKDADRLLDGAQVAAAGDGEGPRAARVDRRRGAGARAVPAPLGRCGQRRQPDRGRGGADQALGALLPLDRV